MNFQPTRKKTQFPELPAIDLELLQEEIISAEEFLKRYKSGDKDTIYGAEIIPPKLGQKGFGKFRVKRNRPVYG
jgi:hypothetical protein